MNAEEYGLAYQNGFRATVQFIAKRERIWFEDAEEIAQEAWARGWELRDQLRDPRFVRTWVNRIAINLFLTQRRKRALVALPPNLPSEAVTTDRIAAEQVLNLCCPSDKRLMAAYYVLGLKVREIAAIEHATEPWVKMRLFRARLAARAFLE